MVSVRRYLRYFRSDHPTLLLCLVAAAIGVVGMAAVDIVIKERYILANRAEAKRRRRAQVNRKPPAAPPVIPWRRPGA